MEKLAYVLYVTDKERGDYVVALATKEAAMSALDKVLVNDSVIASVKKIVFFSSDPKSEERKQ